MKEPRQKQSTIIRQLREQIVRGDWQPGQRLPSRGEFEISTGASRVTVQKIFDRLAKEGFIEVQGRRETRVATSPPHLSRYSIAFAAHPSEPRRWNRFWTVLSDVARSVRRTDGSLAIDVFYNLDGHTDVREYGELLMAGRHHLLAGMIFVGPTPLLTQAPLLRERLVPRVLISRPSKLLEGLDVSLVMPDTSSYYEKAAAHLASRGCGSIAIVMPGGEDYEAKVAPTLARHGLTCPPYWRHSVLPESRQTVSALLHLLMRNPEDRPSGLIIADDHFTDAAATGLMAAGVRVPQDLEVVVHENFPSHVESMMPFKRLGFDAREVVEACVRLIDQERQTGERATQPVLIPAHFVDELNLGIRHA